MARFRFTTLGGVVHDTQTIPLIAPISVRGPSTAACESAS